MRLPDAFIQELKDRSDIGEIVSEYVGLKRSGRDYVGLCPFHSEKTPSFHVHPDEGYFYCFGCGAGGDVITFIKRIENLDYMEAVAFLAKHAGLAMPETYADDGMAKLRTRILQVNRETARYYYSVLNSDAGADGRGYLQKRALKPETVRRFGLGFSPPGRFALVDYLAGKGFTQEEMIMANVAFKSRSGRAVDRFFSRVMFPIIDLRGNVAAFGGRTLGSGEPKYLNTSETPVFNKGSMLFALNFAKKSNGGRRLILCEGYMDVISMHQAGFTDAVATLGTALTPSQARLMSKYAKEVVVSYDSDEAGQKAASRAIPILREAGLSVKVLTISGGKDPDEYIKTYGPAKFKQMLNASGNDVEYRLGKAKLKYDAGSAQGRVGYLNEAVAILAGVDNAMEREIYAGKLAAETGIKTETVMAQVNKHGRIDSKKERKKEFKAFRVKSAGLKDRVNPEKSRYLRAAGAEEAIIAYIIKYPENAKEIGEMLTPGQFVTQFDRRVYQALMQLAENGRPVGITGLAEMFSQDEMSSVARMLQNLSGISYNESDVRKYIEILNEEHEKQKLLAADAAQPREIKNYLDELRRQKK